MASWGIPPSRLHDMWAPDVVNLLRQPAPVCPGCQGAGSVDFNPDWRGDPRYVESMICHLCSGTGTAAGPDCGCGLAPKDCALGLCEEPEGSLTRGTPRHADWED